jgi:predicted site-specific integrase-resolvase
MQERGNTPYDPNEFFTVKETAAILKVKERTIWRWNSEGKIKINKIVGVARIRGSEINRLIGF